MTDTTDSLHRPALARDRGIRIAGTFRSEWKRVLSSEALAFIASLHRKFNARRLELLERRKVVAQEIRSGRMPDFLEETREIRESDWRVAPIPQDLLDRRVEITGPVDRKMIINALNSGASCYMADFEDSTAPTWENVVEGQLNLLDAVQGTIEFETAEKKYKLNDTTATLLVRPRGWHLNEKHLIVDGEAVSASLFDFGLFFFHNANTLIANGSGPYFYLPKMESHLEARLWNDVFVEAQSQLGVDQGTIRATVLIETILATFEADEILWELRDHSAGLNCGRWDYIFSFIKKFSHRPDFTLPDRALVTMTTHFLHSYSLYVIQTCHRRGIHAMGGMAAQIPVKEEAANRAALEKVRADKEREVGDGHDGTWVAHPALVAVAKEIFDRVMPELNQITKLRDDVHVTADDILKVPEGPITEKGFRQNVNVGILYLEAWLRGTGSVALYNLMEDAATAEISRSQLWQWIRHGAKLDDGRPITPDFYRQIRDEELATIRSQVGDADWTTGRFDEAAAVFDAMTLSEEMVEFLTLPAYEELLRINEGE